MATLQQWEFLQSDGHLQKYDWVYWLVRLQDLQDPGKLDGMAWIGICQLCPKNPVKGLKFFCPVSPSESPKSMGLTNIHHPDALCCFNRVTHCLWCGKEGQNEGTIINHLQMMHYKLGLMCKKHFCCPLVTSEAIQHHGQKRCQPSAEGGPDESSSSA